MSRNLVFVMLLLAAGAVLADDVTATEAEAKDAPTTTEKQAQTEKSTDEVPEAQAKTEDGAKLVSGMSILGNQEAPKSLVIVPWKSSGIGDSIGISTMLDDSRQPVDREVFLRALSYYEIRSETKP
jgi:hypothetical protein